MTTRRRIPKFHPERPMDESTAEERFLKSALLDATLPAPPPIPPVESVGLRATPGVLTPTTDLRNAQPFPGSTYGHIPRVTDLGFGRGIAPYLRGTAESVGEAGRIYPQAAQALADTAKVGYNVGMYGPAEGGVRSLDTALGGGGGGAAPAPHVPPGTPQGPAYGVGTAMRVPTETPPLPEGALEPNQGLYIEEDGTISGMGPPRSGDTVPGGEDIVPGLPGYGDLPLRRKLTADVPLGQKVGAVGGALARAIQKNPEVMFSLGEAFLQPTLHLRTGRLIPHPLAQAAHTTKGIVASSQAAKQAESGAVPKGFSPEIMGQVANWHSMDPESRWNVENRMYDMVMEDFKQRGEFDKEMLKQFGETYRLGLGKDIDAEVKLREQLMGPQMATLDMLSKFMIDRAARELGIRGQLDPNLYQEGLVAMNEELKFITAVIDEQGWDMKNPRFRALVDAELETVNKIRELWGMEGRYVATEDKPYYIFSSRPSGFTMDPTQGGPAGPTTQQIGEQIQGAQQDIARSMGSLPSPSQSAMATNPPEFLMGGADMGQARERAEIALAPAQEGAVVVVDGIPWIRKGMMVYQASQGEVDVARQSGLLVTEPGF